MQDEKTKNFIRERFLKNGHSGKCYYINQIVNKDVLLSAKPAYIREYISIILSIDLDKIPLLPLYAWLYRYRKKNQKFKEDSVNNVTDIKNNDISDWRNFIPSTPVKQEDKPLIYFPYRTNDGHQKI